MDLELAGKVAVVTGGSKGIGKACASRLAQEGASVVLVARGTDDLRSAAEEIVARGLKEPLVVPADCCDRGQVARAVARIREARGRIDILVNSAGAARPGTFRTLSDEDWVVSLEAKFFATVRVLAEVIPVMREGGGGRVVTIIGYGGQQPAAWGLAPSAANAGLMNLTRGLATEVARDNILVNAINPGLIDTPRFASLVSAIAEREHAAAAAVRQRLCDAIPLGRIGTPEEVAGLVAFLVSSHATYITGATLLVDGGATRSVF